MKKTKQIKKIKKPKKKTRWQLVKMLDAIFSIFIRLRDCYKSTRTITCPLCPRTGDYKHAQNMHFITRWCLVLRRDETNCHAWCYRCNVLLKGNYIEYTRLMIDMYCIEYVDQLRSKKNEVSIMKTHEIEEKIQYYKEKVSELKLLKAIID